MMLDEPLAVVGFSERQQGNAQLFDGVEGSNPEELLFESSDDALGTAIALRGTDERRRRLDAEECELILEVIAHVWTAVDMPTLETGRDRLRIAIEIRRA